MSIIYETAEDTIRSVESYGSATLAENEHWYAIKRLVAGVRQHGSYKRYARSFHRDVLAVRGLAPVSYTHLTLPTKA